MNGLDYYNRKMKQIAKDAGKPKGKGHWVAWLMMLVGVVVRLNIRTDIRTGARTWTDVAGVGVGRFDVGRQSARSSQREKRWRKTC
jgi:hypothetical protein